MSDETKTGEFVYMGKRWDDDKRKIYIALSKIDPATGRRGDGMLYEYKAKRDRVVGFIYTGVEFTDNGMKGMDAATYTGRRWHDQDERIKWQADDIAASVAKKQRTIEGDAKKSNELETLLLPLRKVYTGYNARGDRIGCQALEQAMLMALRKPVR